MQTENSGSGKNYYEILEKIRYSESVTDEEWSSFCHEAAGTNQLDQDSSIVRRYWNESGMMP